jgi:hypothetical protein
MRYCEVTDYADRDSNDKMLVHAQRAYLAPNNITLQRSATSVPSYDDARFW